MTAGAFALRHTGTAIELEMNGAVAVFYRGILIGMADKRTQRVVLLRHEELDSRYAAFSYRRALAAAKKAQDNFFRRREVAALHAGVRIYLSSGQLAEMMDRTAARGTE